MLRQFFEERKRWTIHGHKVTFPQPCLKAGKKFNNGMAWYAGPDIAMSSSVH